MADWPTVKVEIAWSRRARRHGAYGVPKDWRDVTVPYRPLTYRERARLRYERLQARADRRTWRRHTARRLTAPLAADGRAYRRRCLARRRRR